MSQIHNIPTTLAAPEGNSTAQPGPNSICEAPSSGSDLEERISVHLEALAELAAGLEGQPETLLILLRRLEQLHRTIQDGPFRASLPEDRNALFRLLSEMESSGGWPYIPRLQLRTFLDLLQREPAEDSSALAA